MSEPIDREHLKRDFSEAGRRPARPERARPGRTGGFSHDSGADLCVSWAAAAEHPGNEATTPRHAHLEPGAGARQARARGAVSLYVCVNRIRRRRATRRRSRRAANRATARRAARAIRSIMLTRHIAHSVPATHSVVLLELSDPRHLCAEHAPSHHGLRDDISRKGGGAGAVWRST